MPNNMENNIVYKDIVPFVYLFVIAKLDRIY